MKDNEITKEHFWKNRDAGVEYEVTKCPCGAKYLIQRKMPFMVYENEFHDPTRFEFSQFICIVCETNRFVLTKNMKIVEVF